MVYRANVLSVMIASPSDVIEQRDDIRNTLSDWNFAHSYSRNLILMPVGWETHSAPELSGRAQSIINDRLLKDCDLLVGVFWTKLGTPTGEFESGTAEEISRHVDAGKPAMIYFSDVPVAPESLDLVGYGKLKAFKDELYNKGLVESFSNAEEFRNKFRQQLSIQLNENSYLSGIIRNSDPAKDPSTSAAEMTTEASNLLIAAANDASGHVMSISTLGGRHIQTNGQSFGDPGNARSTALWESALNELVALGYLVSRGVKGEVYQVTNAGYKKADLLKETADHA